jgi:chromosome segregation ATPase
MLKRDPLNGKIISFIPQSEVENNGSIEVAILDGRYVRSDFSRIIDTRFKSLPDAIDAEKTVINKILTAQNRSLLPGEFEKLTGKPLPANLSDQQIRELAKKEFLTNINNLTNSGDNTIGGLQSRIRDLESQMERKDSIISDQLQTISNFDDVLSSVSAERANALTTAEKQREAKVSLQQQADETLFRTELEVIKQREESARAAQELKESLLAVADQRDEITNIQTDIATTNAVVTGLASDIGNINVQLTDQENAIRDADDKATDAIDQSDNARNDANASIFKINEANTKALRDVEPTDTAKEAIDKIFPI